MSPHQDGDIGRRRHRPSRRPIAQQDLIAGTQADSQSRLPNSFFVLPGLCEHFIANASKHDSEQLLEERGFGPAFALGKRAKPQLRLMSHAQVNERRCRHACDRETRAAARLDIMACDEAYEIWSEEVCLPYRGLRA
jgi:hypothetical protein